MNLYFDPFLRRGLKYLGFKWFRNRSPISAELGKEAERSLRRPWLFTQHPSLSRFLSFLLLFL